MPEFITEQVVDEQSTPPVAENQAQEETASAEVKPPAESKPTEPDPAQETKKALKGVQKRIDELTRARYEAEERGRQEAEQARQEAAYWRQMAEQAKQQIGPPRSDQFQDYEQFLRATAAFEAQKVTEERIAAERQQAWAYQQAQAQQAQIAQAKAQYEATIQHKVAEAEKKFPDFVEVVTSPELPGLQGTPAFGAILESEMGAEVMYYLGKNPARAHQIVSLSPLAQVREIGRIEASLSTGKSVTQAPPPPSSVNAQTGTATKSPERMTVDEYYAHITRGRRGK